MPSEEGVEVPIEPPDVVFDTIPTSWKPRKALSCLSCDDAVIRGARVLSTCFIIV